MPKQQPGTRSKYRWNLEKDSMLISIIESGKSKSYINTKLRKTFPELIPKQCFQRYMNNYSRFIVKTELSDDDKIYVLDQAVNGCRKWTEMAKHLGVSPNVVKNYYYLTIKKAKRNDSNMRNLCVVAEIVYSLDKIEESMYMD